jgi:hypothetical protein
LWPKEDGLAQPTVSNINVAPGRVVSNAAAIAVGPGNIFNVFNFSGSTNVVIDVAGTFEAVAGPTAAPGFAGNTGPRSGAHSSTKYSD